MIRIAGCLTFVLGSSALGAGINMSDGSSALQGALVGGGLAAIALVLWASGALDD